MNRQTDWRLVRFGGLAFLLAALVAYCGQPLIHQNPNAINVIVVVFSILAGFLVAIIAVVGDPALLPPGTWRAAEVERGNIAIRLNRFKWLFYAYLFTLAFIFASLLLQKNYPGWAYWLEIIFLFLGAFAFLSSLWLPSSLMRAQIERINMVIEHRRELAQRDDRGG